MADLKKDETMRMPGRRPYTCKVCGAQGKFETYLVREMFKNTRDEFEYFVCDSCHCMQIAEVPENLEDYYGNEYYSMGQPEQEEMEFARPVVHWQKVLDVGCGSGYWLVQKAGEGWGNLYGCDPFLEHDRHYGDRVYIRSCSIQEMEGDGTFDVIRMHDSFEHMEEPLEVLKNVRRLLKADGLLTMTIPVYPNIAFEKYGPHWYQLDAPRHLYLHSKKSLEWLAEKAGLSVTGWKFQSNNGQFVRSFFYQNGIPFYEQKSLIHKYFSDKELTALTLEAERANEKEYGDYAAVNLAVGELPEEGGSRVVFQRFRKDRSRYAFPYPPVYREPDADYICFTTEDGIESGHWRIQKAADLEPETLEPYLEEYQARRELEQDRIQMGPLFGQGKEESLVKVLPLEELPHIKIDRNRFKPTADERGNYKYEKNPVYQKGKYKGRPLLLTIGVPVSNQIETIDRCLSHIKPLLERLDAELVVIDTGSTDGTVEVCRSYGARIYERPWDDNMSAARNEAIRHARGLWYLSIDDDEWFEDVEDIICFFQSGEYRKYTYATYIQRNYMDSEGTEVNDLHTLRMAEITAELHFEGRIHDALSIGAFRCRQLSSFAHHYGFVNDRPDRLETKFLRNATILLEDVREFPEDLRYLFQLANEYKVIKNDAVALRLFAQCVSLHIHFGRLWQGRDSAAGLAGCLYALEDTRLFTWADHLEKAIPPLITDRCLYAFLMTELAFVKGRPAVEVWSYFKQYENLLEEYAASPGPDKKMSYYGLAAVESKYYIASAQAVGFCVCIRLGEEERALELLDKLDLTAAAGKVRIVLEEGFAAGHGVFEALFMKLTPPQWEEWSGTILNAFVAGMVRYTVTEQQKARFPGILSRLSVSAVQSWLESSEACRKGRVQESLLEYALEADEAGRFPDGKISASELALCTFVLRTAYESICTVNAEGKEPSDYEPEVQEKHRQLRNAYVMAAGAFAECCHGPEQLLDSDSGSIPPKTRAVYYMAMALADGAASSENVALLKQALGICPSLCREIRSILTELR